MALVAGAFSRSRDVPLPAGLEQTLLRVISRRADDPRNAWCSPNVVLVHCAIGAFGEPAYVREGTEAVTAVAGDLLLRQSDKDPIDRSSFTDACRLHRSLRANDLGVLGEATGQFAAFHYEARRHALTLVADKLGQGPLYFWASDEMVVFASSLRIIEALDVVPKVMDIRSVLQLSACEFIIGTGTPYAGVRMLGPAEVLRVEGPANAIRRYWRWDQIATSTAPVDELVEATSAALRRAVARRLGRDRTSVAILSGGMDTRLIICELLRRGVRLHTLNGAFPGQQDQVYARLFAEAVGASHQELPRLHGDDRYPVQMARHWYDSEELAEMPPEQPHRIWIGIGGCIGMGGVNLDEPMFAALRAGRLRDGVHHFTSQDRTGIPERVLTASARKRPSNLIEESILAEFRSYDVDDPARMPWLFMMLNEERRAYAALVEEIDVHRLGPHAPLCDSDLLSVLASVPMDLLLRHEFYMRVIERTDRRFFAAPWQTYPGHLPCPVPPPCDVPTQWDRRSWADRRAHSRRSLQRRILSDTTGRDFAKPLFGRARTLAALGLMTFGLRDTHSSLQVVQTVQHFFRVCGGRVAWGCVLALFGSA